MAKQQKVSRDGSLAVKGGSELDDFIGYNLKRAYITIQSGFRDAQGPDGLAPRVFSALVLVVLFPNVTQSELARMLRIERSGLVAIIDELEGRDFVRRTTVPGDRRVQALVATDAGRDAKTSASAAIKALEDRLTSDLTAEEKRLLVTLLGKIRSKEAN